MKLYTSVLAICLLVLLCPTPGLAQNNNIDNERLEADIETALDNALRTIDLEFNFNFEPVEIDLSDLKVQLERLKSDFHNFDFDVNDKMLDDLDIDIDIDADDLEFDRATTTDTDLHDHSRDAENNDERHHEGKDDTLGNSPKHKGLKKIN